MRLKIDKCCRSAICTYFGDLLDRKTLVNLFCWLDVLWRTTVVLTLAVLISEKDKFDWNILATSLRILMIYTIISLAANYLCIVGISKNKSSHMVFYVHIHGFELLMEPVTITAFTSVSIIQGDKNDAIILSVLGIIFLGLHIFKWIHLFKLYKINRNEFQEEKSEDEEVEKVEYERESILQRLKLFRFRSSDQFNINM